MKLTQFSAMRGMEFAHNAVQNPLIDAILNDPDTGALPQLKRIQFDTSPFLADKLDSICSLLNCSKREFLQMAVMDAIEQAETVFCDAYKDVAGREFGTEE
jgi:hypothetical protein